LSPKHSVKLHNIHWRIQDLVLRGPENRSAVGATRGGEGNGEGVSPSPAD